MASYLVLQCLLGILCFHAAIGCDTLSIGGSRHQSSKEGDFVLTNDTCGGRGVYKQIPAKKGNYLFYLDNLSHWIVGSKPCKNNGGIYVKQASALTPDQVTETWKEYKGGRWRYNTDVKTKCKDCQGAFYGEKCMMSCGMCAGGCHSYYGTCNGGCQPGWMGSMCTEACQPGMFGGQCEKQCRCLHNAPCSPGNGTCPTGCQPGWQGDDCSTHDCHLLYERELNSTNGISSLCSHVATYERVPLADCQVRACNTPGNVLNFDPKRLICTVRMCYDGDLMLSTIQGDWEIYVRLDADARMDINITSPKMAGRFPPCQQPSLQAAPLVDKAAQSSGGTSAGSVVVIALVIAGLVTLGYALGIYVYKQYRSGRLAAFSYNRHMDSSDGREDNCVYKANNETEPF